MQQVFTTGLVRVSLASRARYAGAAAAIALALAGFGISAHAFVTGDHRLDGFVLFGRPAPFDPSAPVGPRWAADAAWNLTALGSPEVVVTIVVIATGCLLSLGRIAPAAYVIGSVVSGGTFGHLLKKAFGSVRPHLGPTHGIESATSFPSGHALLASLLFFSLAVLALRCASAAKRHRLGAFAFGAAALLSLTVGLSRVYLGLHWPTDVIAGWAAGAGWAVFFALVFARDPAEVALNGPSGRVG